MGGAARGRREIPFLQREQPAADPAAGAAGDPGGRVPALAELGPAGPQLKEILDTRSIVERNHGLYQQIIRFEQLRQQLIDELAEEAATAAEGMQLKTVTEFSTAIAARLQPRGRPRCRSDPL